MLNLSMGESRMIKLSDYRTQNALPAEMKTPERIALSYAFDRQKKKYINRMRRAYIWADLELSLIHI